MYTSMTNIWATNMKFEYIEISTPLIERLVR